MNTLLELFAWLGGAIALFSLLLLGLWLLTRRDTTESLPESESARLRDSRHWCHSDNARRGTILIDEYREDA